VAEHQTSCTAHVGRGLAPGVALHEELREGVADVIVHDMDPLDREGAMEAQRWRTRPLPVSTLSMRLSASRALPRRSLAQLWSPACSVCLCTGYDGSHSTRIGVGCRSLMDPASTGPPAVARR
jgi:hypothetical protein